MSAVLKNFIFSVLIFSSFVAFTQSEQEKELNNLLQVYAGTVSSNPKEAKTYAIRLQELSAEYKLPNYTAKAHYALGNIAYKEGEFDSSIIQIQQAITYLDSLKIEKGRPACYNLIAVCYKNMGNLSASMENFETCLQWANKLGDKKAEGNAYLNISLIYFQQKSYIDAAQNLDRAAKIYTDIDDYDGIISTRFNFANIMKEQGKYDQARKFYNEVLTYYKQQDNKVMQAYVGINLGQILLDEDKFKEALPQLLDTKKMIESLNLKADLSMVLNDLGFCLKHLGRRAEAIAYYNQALDYIEENPDLYYRAEVYHNLYQIYLDGGEFKKALFYYQKKVEQNETQNSLEKEKHVADLQEKYETRLKEAQIELLEKEKTIKEAELETAAENLKRQQFIRNILLVGFVLVLIALVIIRYFYVQKIRIQKQLAQKKEEIAIQKTNEMIKDFRLRTIEGYQEGQQQERARIAREIHDGIGSELAGLKIAFEQYLSKRESLDGSNNETHRMLNAMRNACQDLRAIAHKLHPLAFSQIGFCDFLEDYITQHAQSAQIEIETLFYPRADIDALKEDLLADVYRIIQELVNNMIKHAGASSSELQLTLHEDYLNIVLIDNGVGMDHDKKKEGIGLRNIKERLLVRNGRMEIDSSDKGTLINIDIGLQKIMQKNEVEV